MFALFLTISVVYSTVSCLPFKSVRDAATCQSCHPVDPNKINVHLIPHSHDDVGWLKTVDQYYYGSRSDIANFGVQYIISSTVESLKINPSRRYVQVETAFFWKWWQHQDETTKQDFVDLVNNGQIEIINAAWSMNDEATTNYQSVIDQFTYGLRIINDTIGECGIPRVGWQIDPFGHSREQASIYAQLGYDAVFFARLDFADKDQRMIDHDLEVIWRGSASLENSNIFANMFPQFYYPPDGFCFDITCGDRIINDERSYEYNLPQKVQDFADIITELSQFYQTNNLLIPMGGDFQYQSAEVNFIHTDRLIQAFQNHESLNLIYSTPSCYIRAVNDAANRNDREFTQKIDDFFPYGSDEHCYWTGYFTSRPNAKRFERVANNFLQSAKQLTAFSRITGNDRADEVKNLQQAVGVLQHHDALTGTAKQAVANDYSRLLAKGIATALPASKDAIIDLLKKDSSSDFDLNLQPCLLANVSICEASQAERFVVSVYNPLERPVTHYVRLPVPDGTYTVNGPEGEEVADILDSISDFSYVTNYLGNPSPKELVFSARIPPFGIRLYYVERTSSRSVEKQPPRAQFGNDEVGFEIDDNSGLLKTVTLNGETLEITQQFLYYSGFNGNNSNDELRASGAYIFRPEEGEATPVSNQVSVTATIGNLVDEVRQQYNDWVTQIIRVYKDANYIEFDWLVGPVEVDEEFGIGREIITRFTVNEFNNEEAFFTDSNGRELIRRQVNKRYDYQYNYTTEPISSNYYPVTSKIVIKDENRNLQVTVLNDRAQGGSSLTNGQIELMVHRRLLADDAKGVDEALNDTEFGQGVVARGQNYLILGSANSPDFSSPSTAAQERIIALKKLLQPVVLVADAGSLSFDDIQESVNLEFAGLQGVLPDNVHILTFEPWKDDTFILRLEHILEANEDDNLSQSVTVDLTGLFTLFEITEIRETTLGANEWLDDFEGKDKYSWTLKGGEKTVYKKSPKKAQAELEVTLGPMQIRTFIIEVSWIV